MTGRFAAPELLQLGRPPLLAFSPFDVLREQALADFAARMTAAGLPFTVGGLRSDPAGKLIDVVSYRDLLRRHQIDDAVAQTFLGSATGAFLDQRAADYGVVRRTVFAIDAAATVEPNAGRPAADWTFASGPARWVEPDDSLRIRARLAWEAQSTAGPPGAYVFHALDADPDVLDAACYGPESGHVAAGEVLVVVQSRSSTGIPSKPTIDAIAARLDASEVVYGDGTTRLRPARDEQSVRPLGAYVRIAACQPVVYTTTATLYVSPDGDRQALRQIAIERLTAYLARRRRIGLRVSREARIAVISLADVDSLPVIEEVDMVEGDVVPGHMQIAVPGTISIETVVR